MPTATVFTMCQGSMHSLLTSIPKVEHHLHIEGTLEPDLLFELAQKNNISLPSPKDDPAFTSPTTLRERYNRFSSLQDFLDYYFIGMSVLLTPSDFSSLTYAYFTRVAPSNLRHAEIFFDPQAHLCRGIPYSTIISGIEDGCARAFTDYGITSERIACLLRHIPAAEGHELYLDTLLPSLKSKQIRGLGLSSTELGNPPHLFKESFVHAKENGILRTAHAGEEADVSYMRSAIEDLDVQRVDHGIKLVDDPELMRLFVERGILITMCPVSNVFLKCVKNVGELPIRKYLDAGVKFSINSDDPSYFGGNYLQDVFCAVQEAFGLSVKEWAQIATNSIEGSWCEKKRKDEVLKELGDVVEKYA